MMLEKFLYLEYPWFRINNLIVDFFHQGTSISPSLSSNNEMAELVNLTCLSYKANRNGLLDNVKELV